MGRNITKNCTKRQKCEIFEIAVKASKKFLTAEDEGEQSVNLCNYTFS